MAEYIDREEAKKALGKSGLIPRYAADNRLVTDEIMDAVPAADVKPVVHCRDCRLRGREDCAMFYRCDCGEQHTWETDDDFCSYGERS